MPKTRRILLVVALALTAGAVARPLRAQDPRPLAPILAPAEGTPRDGVDSDGGVVPLPEAGSRSAAAEGARARVVSVLPAAWTDVATAYQPFWVAVRPVNAFGVDRWSSYFGVSGMVPALAPHPFLGPWGLMSYDGWIYERYRAIWTPSDVEPRLATAADALRRGDRALAAGDPAAAAMAYGLAVRAVPELPLGYLGLGAARVAGDDEAGAARAFRQALDRYPSWLSLDIDLSTLLGRDRMRTLRGRTAARAALGSADGRFVAGVVGLFGGDPAAGRRWLEELPPDRYTEQLLSRGPR